MINKHTYTHTPSTQLSNNHPSNLLLSNQSPISLFIQPASIHPPVNLLSIHQPIYHTSIHSASIKFVQLPSINPTSIFSSNIHLTIIHPPACLFIYPYPTIHQSTRLSACLPVYWGVHLFMHPFIHTINHETVCEVCVRAIPGKGVGVGVLVVGATRFWHVVPETIGQRNRRCRPCLLLHVCTTRVWGHNTIQDQLNTSSWSLILFVIIYIIIIKTTHF